MSMETVSVQVVDVVAIVVCGLAVDESVLTLDVVVAFEDV